MKMTIRWFGEGYDNVTLDQIRQIPNVTGVITTLYNMQAGEKWPLDKILELKKQVESKGLKIEGIESVNIHEDIKLGLPSREKYIENYKETLRNLGRAGISLVCYNFMPVFDWIRTNLAKELPDGSTVLSYDDKIVKRLNPDTMFEHMEADSNGFLLPGWEPERLKEIKTLLEKYKGYTEDMLFENLGYFLKQIIPVCEEYGINMAIHPDDPPWPVFGLPRIVTDKKNLQRIAELVNSKCNGFTICTGSLGANPDNDLPDMIRHFGSMGRIHFGHLRNIKIHNCGSFDEASHLSTDGTLDMFEIVKAFYDIGFKGPIRPDHGRMIWGEKGRPGYGLYDRALGAAYLNGLWEAIDKLEKKGVS
ncbi:MAG: mannonate dehydratase [Peptococcaceae bacterium]|jgi:mannonate dehydratase|nr:mannonate dehydratase [Peptococcaceae bacterium]MDH7524403.1 mannonate dehydratase [Peptococcaceae bacterium]